jgi:hypothetical protein
MKQTIFEKLISGISSKLNIIEELGTPITNDLIDENIDEIAGEFRNIPNFEMTDADVARLKFHIGNMFNVRVGEEAISLRNPELPRWFDSKKTSFTWSHWKAYEQMLESKGRPKAILKANEKVIDDILDYSGDPSTPGPWSRKGLVMGNVQSGKTQNYIGLVNKAIDCGYKTIILLGGHLNDLRRQTQERVDEGVLGVESRHLADVKSSAPLPIGVGVFHQISINTGTTTVGDFNKAFAGRLGFKLTGEDPVIFTVKKHTGVMEKLHKWIKDYHYLSPEIGKKLDGPLLLIDDEADYASINTKHHKEEVTKTNAYIRQLLSLFNRNTYVGYTATPFANIFIDPDDSEYSDDDDLFPSDFMIKIPVPDNYLGQDYFFGQKQEGELEDGQSEVSGQTPTVVIEDHASIYELKKYQEVVSIPESLKEAVRAFLIVIAVRALRGEKHSHNTMLVNISHLKAHQNQLEQLIDIYYQEIDDALGSFSGLGIEQARTVDVLSDIETTFGKLFSVGETYEEVFSCLREASAKINVWAINMSTQSIDGRDLDYSKHKEHGLCAIVIGGHKLSRGLTLEGLSISYFARNSKAYDTLMQMCRWFGYRPNYDDLCRVFLPAESIDWYSFISSAIRELYQELELMSRREQRPKDFGLKVREHPGAMIITAKNKIGWSDTTVRSQDLWGQVQRRFRFRPDEEVNLRNLDYAKRFVSSLMDEGKKIVVDKDSGALVIEGVEYERLIDFIENVDLPEDDLGNQALKNHLRKMEKADLVEPKVILFNQQGSRPLKWTEYLNEDEQNFINGPRYEFLPGRKVQLAKRRMIQDAGNGNYKVTSVHLGNSDDEKLFISPTARDGVATNLEGKKPVSFDYMCSEEREAPGLLIYLFAVAVGPDLRLKNLTDEEKEALRLGHGCAPTIGYTVSFPRSENLKGKSSKEIAEIVKQTKHEYRVDKVSARLKELNYYEEFEEDE